MREGIKGKESEVMEEGREDGSKERRNGKRIRWGERGRDEEVEVERKN